MGEIRYGGPSEGDEKCPACGTRHHVRRSGSWDWEPKLCEACGSAKFQAELYKQETATPLEPAPLTAFDGKPLDIGPLSHSNVDQQFCSDWLKDEIRGLFSTLAQRDAEITALKKRIAWLESGDIHTCHDECQKPACIQRRRAEAAEAERDRWKRKHEQERELCLQLTAERGSARTWSRRWKAAAKEWRNSRGAQLVRTIFQKARADVLAKEVTEARKERDEFKAMYEHFRDMHTACHKERDAARKELSEAQAEIERRRETEADLIDGLSDLEAAYDSLLEDLTAAESENDLLAASLASAREALEEAIDVIREQSVGDDLSPFNLKRVRECGAAISTPPPEALKRLEAKYTAEGMRQAAKLAKNLMTTAWNLSQDKRQKDDIDALSADITRDILAGADALEKGSALSSDSAKPTSLPAAERVGQGEG